MLTEQKRTRQAGRALSREVHRSADLSKVNRYCIRWEFPQQSCGLLVKRESREDYGIPQWTHETGFMTSGSRKGDWQSGPCVTSQNYARISTPCVGPSHVSLVPTHHVANWQLVLQHQFTMQSDQQNGTQVCSLGLSF